MLVYPESFTFSFCPLSYFVYVTVFFSVFSDLRVSLNWTVTVETPVSFPQCPVPRSSTLGGWWQSSLCPWSQGFGLSWFKKVVALTRLYLRGILFPLFLSSYRDHGGTIIRTLWIQPEDWISWHSIIWTW